MNLSERFVEYCDSANYAVSRHFAAAGVHPSADLMAHVWWRGCAAWGETALTQIAVTWALSELSREGFVSDQIQAVREWASVPSVQRAKRVRELPWERSSLAILPALSLIGTLYPEKNKPSRLELFGSFSRGFRPIGRPTLGSPTLESLVQAARNHIDCLDLGMSYTSDDPIAEYTSQHHLSSVDHVLKEEGGEYRFVFESGESESWIVDDIGLGHLDGNFRYQVKRHKMWELLPYGTHSPMAASNLKPLLSVTRIK